MRRFLIASMTFLALVPLNAGQEPAPGRTTAEAPFLTSELLFPLEHWHNHASMIVELPGGDLLTCWFHGSGERTADDVMVLGFAEPQHVAAHDGDPVAVAPIQRGGTPRIELDSGERGQRAGGDEPHNSAL